MSLSLSIYSFGFLTISNILPNVFNHLANDSQILSIFLHFVGCQTFQTMLKSNHQVDALAYQTTLEA